MPLIPRQERFCQAFVYYGTAAAAARAAGYAPASARKQGWRLMRAARIRARIREIQIVLADHQDRTPEAVMGKLEIVYRRALENHQFYAAGRAAELQAKLAARIGRVSEANEGIARTVNADRAGAAPCEPEMTTQCGHMRPMSQIPSQMYASSETKPSAAVRPSSRRR